MNAFVLYSARCIAYPAALPTSKATAYAMPHSLPHQADLRFALVRIREHAESIAFYCGGDREASVVLARLRSLMTAAFEQARLPVSIVSRSGTAVLF